MSATLLASALLLAAEPSLTAGPDHPNAELTSLVQVERELSAALQQQAQAKQPLARAEAIGKLCDLHARIVSDPRYATSTVLPGYRNRIWSRLNRVKQDLRRELARESDSAAAPQEVEDQLRLSAASLASAQALSDYAGGAPMALLARGGAAQIEANAQSLIELIERTISPDFWDVNGGPGTIVYYPNLQCLVIRATSEVHGKVGGVLGGVRAAGR